MDKISKALKKLTDKEKAEIKEILQAINAGDFKGFNIKKLKGREDIFRVRKRKFRIIYKIKEKKDIFILAIERRGDNTYKF